MEEKLKIIDHPFSNKEIALVDSFVLTKLGEGHGESTLYLGGKGAQEGISSFFDTSSKEKRFQVYFLKENILKVLNFYQAFYKNPHSFYMNDGRLIEFQDDLSQHYEKCIKKINASDEYISNEVELLNPDSQDRQYLRVFSGSILREMFLPYSVKICFIKIHLHNNSDLDILIECSPYIAAKKHIIKAGGKSVKVEFNYFNSPS
jgi:hypothetical protein